jgi:hypothetical protein
MFCDTFLPLDDLPAFAATFLEQHIRTVAVLSCFPIYGNIIKYILLSGMTIE